MNIQKNHMNTRTKTLGLTLAWAFVIGMLAATIGLFGLDGQPQAFAQTDTTAPTVSSIAITSNPDDDAVITEMDGEGTKVGNWSVYGIDDSIEVTVAFSVNATVTGSPRLELEVGGSARTAEYESTDGSNVKFTYTVAENDEDTDGVSIGANKLTLNGGTIRGDADQDADLSHDALSAQKKHKVDGIRPSFKTILFSASNTYNSNGYYEEGEEVFIKVQFSEDSIYVSGTPQLTIGVGVKERKATFERTSFGDLFVYTVQEGDLDLDGPSFSANSVNMNGGYIRDGAGNDIKLNHDGASAGLDSKVDAVAPTVSAVAITSDPGADDTYATGDMVEVSVTFSEEVWVPDTSRSDLSGTRHPELDLRIGSDTRSAKSGLQELGRVVKFTYTIQPGDTDTDGVSINANALRLNGGIIFDAAGNNPISATIHNIPDIPIDAVVPHDAVADDSSHMVAGSSSSLTLRGPTTTDYKENSKSQVGSVYTVSGTDADITWGLSGDDGSHFSLRGASYSKGLRFTSAPNYEDPRDANSDNEYGLTIEVSDGTNTSSLQVVVTVTNEWIDSDEVPVITGKALVGQTLTADVSRISDHADSTFYYSWIRNDGTADTDIDGATNSTYTLTANDEGKTIKVRVISWDYWDYGVDLFSRTTAATVAVAAKPNTAPTGLPTTNGTPQVGETLTASTSDIDDADGISGAAFTYQWLSSRDPEIQGATDRTYTLAATDKGKTIKVMVSFTDDAKNEESLTSAATAEIAAKPNSAATGLPTVSGTPQVGETLTVDTSGISDADGLTNVSFSYQWIRNDGDTDTNIAGGTGATYILGSDDEGQTKTIKVRVSFTDDAGNAETLTSAATEPVAAAEPTERPARPSTLTAAEVSHDSVTLTWRDPQDDSISGYVILRRDKDIHEKGTFETVKADTGTAETTYTDDSVMPERRYVYRIKAINAYGKSKSSWVRAYTPAAPTTEQNTPATGEPTVSGKVQVGEILTADTSGIVDADGLDNATFSYQWVADDTNIDGATGSSYTLADADEGKAVKVRVSFTDDAGNSEELTSDATEAVAAKPNSPATGAPTISGMAQVGETLTADTSGIGDEDGLDNASFSSQWIAGDADIPGATNSTYTLADADEGKTVKVRVSFTDDGDNDETLTSAATSAVAARPNRPATGAPTISGTAQVGETLTADTSGIADEDGLTNAVFSYQWQADGAEISGTTGSTYTLVDADEGKAISVAVSFTDDAGNDETLTSAASAAVEAAPLPPLTASLENVATSHDGESVFTFELRFSEEFSLSYKTLRDHAFTVTGGTVKKAQRLEQGSNMGWRITVRPDGNGQVAVVLPETTDCDAQGAICTEDGRMLSHRLELTVSGP